MHGFECIHNKYHIYITTSTKSLYTHSVAHSHTPYARTYYTLTHALCTQSLTQYTFKNSLTHYTHSRTPYIVTLHTLTDLPYIHSFSMH